MESIALYLWNKVCPVHPKTIASYSLINMLSYRKLRLRMFNSTLKIPIQSSLMEMPITCVVFSKHAINNIPSWWTFWEGKTFSKHEESWRWKLFSIGMNKILWRNLLLVLFKLHFWLNWSFLKTFCGIFPCRKWKGTFLATMRWL